MTLKTRYSVIITTANEPELAKACMYSIFSSILYQSYRTYDFEVLVVAPDKETERVATTIQGGLVRYIKDKGKGKIAALNLALKKANGEILIFTDGDCIIRNIGALFDAFDDSIVGLATGRVVSKDMPNNFWGFAHDFLLGGAHYIRKRRDFVEATGYLFGFRRELFLNNMHHENKKCNITKFPDNVAEDSWASAEIYSLGYKTKYVPEATVAVKGPTNMKDWLSQKGRCISAHEKQQGRRVKTLGNEIIEGIKYTLFYYSYKNYIELFVYLPRLYIMRLYVWLKVKLSRQQYKDGWKSVASTK